MCVCACARHFVCVQIAGNPDQQEDTLDDQYQEEVEDEVCNTHDLHVEYSSRVD